MGLIDRYRVWKVMHLLNRIPYLLSREQFEVSDRLLIEASRVYSALPKDVKTRKIQLEDLFVEMEKLLGSEFRRKLDRQIGEERFSRISAPVIRKRMNVAYGKNTARNFLVRKRQQAKKGILSGSLKKMKRAVMEKPSFVGKLGEWKKKGYDTSIVEKQLRSKRAKKNTVANVVRAAQKHRKIVIAPKVTGRIVKQSAAVVPDARLRELREKIDSWKRQGYDTTMLENQLKLISK